MDNPVVQPWMTSLAAACARLADVHISFTRLAALHETRRHLVHLCAQRRDRVAHTIYRSFRPISHIPRQLPPPRPSAHASPVFTGSRAIVKFLATPRLHVRAIAGQAGTIGNEDFRGRRKSRES